MVMVRDYKGVTMQKMTATFSRWFALALLLMALPALAKAGKAILTAGLLGEQYIGLSVGGAPEVLQDGDTIRDTQSALVLEELIQQFVSNMVSN